MNTYNDDCDYESLVNVDFSKNLVMFYIERKAYCLGLIDESRESFSRRLYRKTVDATEKPDIIVCKGINIGLYRKINAELKLDGYKYVTCSVDYSSCIFSMHKGEDISPMGGKDIGVVIQDSLIVADSDLTKKIEMSSYKNILYYNGVRCMNKFFNGEKIQ